MNKKKKRIIIIVCVTLIVLIALPFVLVYGIIGLIAIDQSRTPDNSKDPLIPSGYVETDGTRGYGAGDWEEYNYYKYEKTPEFDEKYFSVTQYSDERLPKLLSHFGYGEMWDDLEGELSDGDCYYIARINGEFNSKYGALMYFYDNETKTLHRIDFCW